MKLILMKALSAITLSLSKVLPAASGCEIMGSREQHQNLRRPEKWKL